jgi:hypothetical protein
MALDFPASPTSGQIYNSWRWNGTAWASNPASTKYIIACFVPGVLAASQMLLNHTFGKAVTFPANFGSYLGFASEARGTAAATASLTVTVQKATAAAPTTFTNVGTIVFSASGIVASSFTTSGGTTLNYAQGDSLQLVAPATPDTTFAGFSASLVGYET